MAPALCVSFAVMICMTTVACSNPRGWPLLGEIMASPGFRKYLLAVSRLARLDILMPPGYGPNEERSLTLLLKDIPVSVVLFSRSYRFNNYENDLRRRRDRHALLWFFDGNPESVPVDTSISLYYIHLAVVTKDVRKRNIAQRNRDNTDLKAVMYCVNFLITVIDQKILTVGQYKMSCLNCTSGTRDEPEVTPLHESALEGRRFRMYCRELYTCESSMLETLTQLLVHRNVSFSLTRIRTTQSYVNAVLSTNVYAGTLILFPISFPRSQRMFPAMSSPFYYDVNKETFFEEAQKSMTKEAVLFVPFCTRIWLALLIVFVVCLLVSFLISRIHLGRVHDFFSLGVVFAASFLQQSCPANKDALRHQSFRILLGVWMLMATVLATGYKGVVTTLLGNVPLLGELGTFLREDGLEHLNLCPLDFPLEHHYYQNNTGYYRDPHTNTTCLSASKSGKKRRTEKEVYVTMLRGSQNMEKLIDIVLSRGYVQLREAGSPFVTGPEMRSASPYYKPVGRLLSRAFEAGLFRKVTRVDVLKKSQEMRVRPEASADPGQALKVTDLRPAFVVWVAGIAFIFLGFFVPYFAFLVHRFGVYIKAKYLKKKHDDQFAK